MTLRCGILALALLGLPATAMAQGSGSTHDPVIRPSFSDAGIESFMVLRSIEATLLAVDEKEGVAVVDEEKTGRRILFPLDPKVRVKADKKSELGGRKKLTLGDLKPGHLVKLTFRTTDAVVVEMRLKAPRG